MDSELKKNGLFSSLFSAEFLALNGIIFLVFCNVAVFFQFQQYLQNELHLPARQQGTLIGVFALTALVVRPIISPFLHSANARKWLFISAVGVVLSLLLYYPARSFWSLTLVRIGHGGIYVVLATAALTKMMDSIPEDKSGQAFGLITVITLLPYAVLPPLLDPLIRVGGGFRPVLFITAWLMVFTFPLLLQVKSQKGEIAETDLSKPSWKDQKENLKDPRIFFLLLISLLVYSSFSPVFFYLKGFALKQGIPNPGWFFTLSTLMEIAVRVLGGSLLDRGSKVRTLLFSLSGLTAACFFLAHVSHPIAFWGLGFWFGIGWGVALPLLNGLIFDCSQPRFRALNTNLAMVMFQGGFFLGPLAGGWVLELWDYKGLYYTCGLMVLIAILLTLSLKKIKKEKP
ncbi:MAG: MFS transporter [Thermodesulfobacteriota bacterium]